MGWAWRVAFVFLFVLEVPLLGSISCWLAGFHYVVVMGPTFQVTQMDIERLSCCVYGDNKTSYLKIKNKKIKV